MGTPLKSVAPGAQGAVCLTLVAAHLHLFLLAEALTKEAGSSHPVSTTASRQAGKVSPLFPCPISGQYPGSVALLVIRWILDMGLRNWVNHGSSVLFLTCEMVKAPVPRFVEGEPPG